MKTKHYQRLGVGLFASLLLLAAPHALAEENMTSDPIETSSTSTATPPTTEAYTDNSQLNQAISQAKAEGIMTAKTEEESFETAQESQENYSQQTQTVIEAIQNYQEAKRNYQTAEKAHQEYLKQVETYQQDLVQYQDYQKKEQQYQVDLKTYRLAKARYDEDYQTALGNTDKAGYLPEVLAQNLIFRSEPNATQTFTGTVIPDAILNTVVKDSNGWMDPGTVTAPLTKQTVTTKGAWNSALMTAGDTVIVDYNDLENSSFSGYQLKKVRYTYKLLATTHYSGKVIFQAIADPTVTSYTHIYNKDGKTQSSFEMEMTVQFFDASGKEIIPTAENYALTSFASINSFEGQGEFVGKYNGTFLPINGSTITVQNDYALNHSNTHQEALVADWDSEASPDAYIGAIVGKSTERIRFTFGNTNGFADWFAFNSDIKVKGGILNPPTPPIAPTYMSRPVKPKEVQEPQAILTPIILYHRNKVVPKPVPPKKTVTSQPTPTVKVTPAPPQVTHPITIIYTYAKPTKAIQTSIGTVVPTTVPLSPMRQAVVSPPTKQNKPIQKKETASSKTDWFGINTGITDSVEKNELINFIKKIGKEAKKKYGKDKNTINKEIALTLASPSYSTDFLQSLYNTYDNYTNKVPKDIQKTIISNHWEGKIDFAHVMTTLASLEKQSFTDETTKHYASRTLVLPLFTDSPPLLREVINNTNQRTAILQQNSLIGDLLTTMPISDVYTDMDAIILAKHPDYKELPLDERILKYYGQEDLDKKRKELFLQVYGKGKITDKGEAQLSSFMDIIYNLLTVGGLGALVYSVSKGNWKNIGKNVKTLDTVLYDGNIDKFRKHPFKTTASFIGKTVDKRIIKPATKAIQAINTKVVKPIVNVAKKVVSKVGHFVTKTVPKAIKKAATTVTNFVTKTIPKSIAFSVTKTVSVAKKAYTAVRKVIPKPVKRTIKKVFRPIVKPVQRVVKRVTSFVKKVFNSVKKAIKPRKKGSRKRRR